MLKAIGQNYTGIRGHQQMLDVTAHNISNVNTVGFKQKQVSFQELTYRYIAERRLPWAGNPPVAPQSGRGTAVFSTTRLMAQGNPMDTGRSLDVAILGDGFFRVIMPDGSFAYTRDGGFLLDDDGNLILSGGIRLDPELRLAELGSEINWNSLKISQDGTILVYPIDETNSGKDMSGDDGDALSGGAILLGQIMLYRFINPESLDHIGGNFLVPSAASGPPVASTPGKGGAGLLEEGYLERSNVDLAEQMTNLIRGQRALQSSSRALVTADELWGLTISIIQG